jgi:hypothetical protein
MGYGIICLYWAPCNPGTKGKYIEIWEIIYRRDSLNPEVTISIIYIGHVVTLSMTTQKGMTSEKGRKVHNVPNALLVSLHISLVFMFIYCRYKPLVAKLGPLLQ